MTAEQFAYWLQGFVELAGAQPTPEQWQSIKEHLQTVFKKVTPPLGKGGFPSYPPGVRTMELRPADLGNQPVAIC